MYRRDAYNCTYTRLHVRDFHTETVEKYDVIGREVLFVAKIRTDQQGGWFLEFVVLFGVNFTITR